MSSAEAAAFGANSVVSKSNRQPGARVISIPLGKADKGDFVRASLVYDACPGAPSMVRDTGIVNNLDIALCGRRNGGPRECIFVSESYDDAIEGFDVSLPNDYEMLHYLIILPSAFAVCPNKDGSMPSWPVEPIGHRVVMWP
ncbi:MAG: hypothetical protein HC923_02425 [Myxococcales bacterium]|nr:hypothetical protein [Myxococcales bacterium]